VRQVGLEHLRRKAEILMSDKAKHKGRNRDLSSLQINTMIAEGLRDGVGLEKEQQTAAQHVAHAKQMLAEMKKEKAEASKR
jgi:hypothetical protein